MGGWEKNDCKGKRSETVKQDNPKKCVIGPIKRRLFGKEEHYSQEKKDFNPDPASYIESVFFSLAAEKSKSPQNEGDKQKAFKDIKKGKMTGWNCDEQQSQEINRQGDNGQIQPKIPAPQEVSNEC